MKDFSIFDYESEHDAQSSPEVCYEVTIATLNTMKAVGCAPKIIEQAGRAASSVYINIKLEGSIDAQE